MSMYYSCIIRRRRSEGSAIHGIFYNSLHVRSTGVSASASTKAGSAVGGHLTATPTTISIGNTSSSLRQFYPFSSTMSMSTSTSPTLSYSQNTQSQSRSQFQFQCQEQGVKWFVGAMIASFIAGSTLVHVTPSSSPTSKTKTKTAITNPIVLSNESLHIPRADPGGGSDTDSVYSEYVANQDNSDKSNESLSSPASSLTNNPFVLSQQTSVASCSAFDVFLPPMTTSSIMAATASVFDAQQQQQQQQPSRSTTVRLRRAIKRRNTPSSADDDLHYNYGDQRSLLHHPRTSDSNVVSGTSLSSTLTPAATSAATHHDQHGQRVRTKQTKAPYDVSYCSIAMCPGAVFFE
jgi:hypothetical protein